MTDIKTPTDLQDNILSADVALLDFWAPWCGPCRTMMPALEALQANNPNLVIGKVNVDENQALAQTFGIRSIPTLILFRKGEVKGTLVGAQSLERLQQFVNG
ncbi:thioredoxin [Burkholderia ubonensis]|uniref:thioredoxin n=1 Tax=Burkholderia ubonensis TaxID=101571 RepID=UPI0007558F2B|nr:thioredoxin [Burkholderia ubonensis]KVP17228.1 hypothetical protein WJ84_02810 [Burkholderia ubonensis]KVP39647.1 hypothetical protein WJ87_05540 [Burkholderia ubonensis]